MFGCTRRDLMRAAGAGGAAWVLSGSRLLSLFADDGPERALHPGSDWEAKPDGQVQCHVCPFD